MSVQCFSNISNLQLTLSMAIYSHFFCLFLYSVFIFHSALATEKKKHLVHQKATNRIYPVYVYEHGEWGSNEHASFVTELLDQKTIAQLGPHLK